MRARGSWIRRGDESLFEISRAELATAGAEPEGTPADLVAARSTVTGEHLADYVGAGAAA